MPNETRKLGQDNELVETAVPEKKLSDHGVTRPWRIALRLVQLQMEMIFDLTGTMVIGRANPDTGFYPDIDLGAYGGSEQGVSREHLFIKLDGDQVVVVDNKSANHTKLNGELLKPDEAYPVRHGDELMLGLMKLQIELLTNGYD